MPSFDIAEKRPCINIFKFSCASYFKYYFDDPELIGSLNRSMRSRDTRFKMATSGDMNKETKLLYTKGHYPTLIEDPALVMVEIIRYQKYGDPLKSSVNSYPLSDMVVLIMKDIVY